LSAECNGSTLDCPHSDAWRAAVISTPVVVALFLLVGAVWSVVSRRVRPLVLAEAAALALVALVDGALSDADIGTGVLLATASFVVWRALRG
jgi:hypothetical protein